MLKMKEALAKQKLKRDQKLITSQHQFAQSEVAKEQASSAAAARDQRRSKEKISSTTRKDKSNDHEARADRAHKQLLAERDINERQRNIDKFQAKLEKNAKRLAKYKSHFYAHIIYMHSLRHSGYPH